MDYVTDDIVATTLKHRDKVLEDSLIKGERVDFRAMERDKDKKRKFLNQKIVFRINDKNGQLFPGCEFKLIRRNLQSTTALVSCIKKSPLSDFEMDYFVDQDGSIFWFEDLFLHSKPMPECYIIIPKIKRIAYDIKTDERYVGDTIIMIKNVPNYAHDGVTIVDEYVLREWIFYAITEEDPKLKAYQHYVDDAKAELEDIDAKIKNIPKMDFREKDGILMTEKRAEKERETLYKYYQEERLIKQKQLKQKIIEYDEVKQNHLNISMEFTRLQMPEYTPTTMSSNMNTNTNTASTNKTDDPNKLYSVQVVNDFTTWLVLFDTSKESKDIEDCLILKNDWYGIRVACGSAENNYVPWTGRGKIPDGKKAGQFDYRKTEVDISAARISRVPHGIGMYRTLDKINSKIRGYQFYMYYGYWECGLRHGKGIEITDSGVYSGMFSEDSRDGYGRYDMADGTTITGYSQKNEYFPSTVASPIFIDGSTQNPYLTGDIHGNVNIMYSDGSTYVGSMQYSRISGYGEYKSPFGEIFKGQFFNGLLHDSNGYYQNQVNEIYQGEFQYNELCGEGMYNNQKGDNYIGSFLHHYKHGRGVYTYKNEGARYTGYYCYDQCLGKGMLEYKKMNNSMFTEKKKKTMSESTHSASNNNNDNNNKKFTTTATATQNDGSPERVFSKEQTSYFDSEEYKAFQSKYNKKNTNPTTATTTTNSTNNTNTTNATNITTTTTGVKSSSTYNNDNKNNKNSSHNNTTTNKDITSNIADINTKQRSEREIGEGLSHISLSEYNKSYYGYFIGQQVMNGGYMSHIHDLSSISAIAKSHNTTTTTSNSISSNNGNNGDDVDKEEKEGRNTTSDLQEKIILVSIKNKKLLKPLKDVIKKHQLLIKKYNKKLEKLIDMETYIYREIIQKKMNIYNIQKHHIKKQMLLEERHGHGAIESILDEHENIREDRLIRINIQEMLSTPISVVPGVRLDNLNQRVDHLSSIMNDIRQYERDINYEKNHNLNTIQTNDYYYYDEYEDRFYDPHMIAKIAISHIEESQEKQKLIRYNELWTKAEDNYIQYKRGK